MFTLLLLTALNTNPFTCYESHTSGSVCHQEMKSWVKSHPEDAFKAGKITRLYMNHWLAVPFFEQAIGREDFKCKDNDLRLAVLGAYNLPATGNESVLRAADKIAFLECFREFKKPLYEAAAPDTHTFVNVCSRLSLKGIKKKKCDELLPRSQF